MRSLQPSWTLSSRCIWPKLEVLIGPAYSLEHAAEAYRDLESASPPGSLYFLSGVNRELKRARMLILVKRRRSKTLQVRTVGGHPPNVANNRRQDRSN